MDIFAVDVDGVVADLQKEWLRRYNEDYNDNFPADKWIIWDIHRLIKPKCGIKIYEYLEDPTIYDNVEPIEGALEAIEKLSNFFRIIFVTNSTLGASGAKYNWLNKYKFIYKLDDYIECKDKSLVRANWLIDDRMENLLGFCGKKILYTQPWNIHSGWEGFKIKSWKDFLKENIKRV